MKSPTERRRTFRRTRFTIDALTAIAIFVAAGFVIWRNWPSPPPPPIPLPAEPLGLNDAPTKGNSGASVVALIYSDFECPYCGNFARGTLSTIDRLYVSTGKVRLAYRYAAPPNHPRALPSAIAAECAGRQGKFWEMHDRLFANQGKLDDATLAAHADTLGLDAGAFKACLGDRTTADRVARDGTAIKSLHIGGTPAFFVGTVQPDGRVRVTRTLQGAIPLGDFQEALDEALGEGPLAWLSSVQHPKLLGGASVTVVMLVCLGYWMRRRRLRALEQPGRVEVAGIGQS